MAWSLSKPTRCRTQAPPTALRQVRLAPALVARRLPVYSLMARPSVSSAP